MKLTLLLIVSCVMLFACAQERKFSYPDTPKPSIRFIAQEVSVNYQKPDIKLDKVRSKRLIISGAVLTGVGPALLVVGAGLLIHPQPGGPQGGGMTNNVVPGFVCVLASPAVFIAGLPTLIVGLKRRHKLQQMENDAHVSAGVMSNGHMGFALAF